MLTIVPGTILLAQWHIWLTPIWLLAAGASVGLVVLFAIWGAMWLASRDASRQALATVKESVLLPIFYLAMLLMVFALAMMPYVPVQAFRSSLGRIFSVGSMALEENVPGRAADHKVNISFRAEELKRMTVTSDQDIALAARPGALAQSDALDIEGGEPWKWNLTSGGGVIPFQDQVDALYVSNESDVAAGVGFEVETNVEYPEVYSVLVTAAALVGLVLFYLLIAMTMPKLSAIAMATSKEACSQPIFYLALAVGACALIIFIYIPYNTFGDDVKMLKGSGLTLIMVLAIVVALWTASVSVAEEIEGRTALTLLSKPISRPQFVLGKFLGIIWPLVLIYVVLGFLFLLTISYKVVYDARESSGAEPPWQECYLEMIRTVPGLVLAFMETVVLASISVAISTRLPMLPNLIICASIYALGHLVPMIVQSAAGQFQIVEFMGRFIGTLLPVLDDFNVEAAADHDVPLQYLAWAGIYCLLYSTIAMLLALFMFEDRDLA